MHMQDTHTGPHGEFCNSIGNLTDTAPYLRQYWQGVNT